MKEEFLWWRDGVIYQIYPRSFYDSDGSGIGDLKGITEKLDYLADLGIDAIWLSPINPSPDKDFGYDVSDYLSIDPKFGSMVDFESLLRETGKRGIRVIMDLVLNHSSNQHPWFLESHSSRDNPKRDWYIWRDGKKSGRPPNNWLAVMGGSAWEWDELTEQYYLHHYYKEQPDFNWRHPEVRKRLLDVFRFWLDKGVKGFRLDVFNLFFKDSQLRDNPVRPFQLRPDQRRAFIYNCDRLEMLGLLFEIRNLLDEFDESYAIGETLLSNPEKSAKYCGNDRLHQAFLFDFLMCSWETCDFENTICYWEKALGPNNWPNYVLNNHDVKRYASRFGHGEDDERLKVAAAMLLTLRGTPFLYYGEEIGMREVSLKRSQILDPVGLRFWPFYKGRDGCRTPMQWDGTKNAGFTAGHPWLPLHPDWRQRNVKFQVGDKKSLLNFYKALIALRRTEPVLVKGDFRIIKNMPKDVMGYQRKYKNREARVYLNFGKKEHQIPICLDNRIPLKIFSNKREKPSSFSEGMINLRGNEALILVSENLV